MDDTYKLKAVIKCLMVLPTLGYFIYKIIQSIKVKFYIGMKYDINIESPFLFFTIKTYNSEIRDAHKKLMKCRFKLIIIVFIEIIILHFLK
jgi:hypothetical protein